MLDMRYSGVPLESLICAHINRIRSYRLSSISSEVTCHHGDAQTNKPTKRDGMVGPLISPLHNTDKASAGPPIG